MPDDEDPKVRRNLVTFCATLLLFAWLQIPVGVITAKYFDKTPMDPLRLWLAATLILIYLYLRYHFAGGGRDAFSNIKTLFRSVVNKQIEDFLPFHFQDTARVTCAPPLADIVHKFREEPAVQEAIRAGSVPQIAFGGWTGFGLTKYDGTLVVKVVWPKSPDSSLAYHQIQDNIGYEIAPAIRRRFNSYAFWQSWIFSGASVTHLAAMLLSAATAVLIAYRLYTILTI